MAKLVTIEAQMLAAPDQQVSLTDPDSRSMATSGRGSGVVGYNVQVAVDTKHHLIVVHDVINVGNDRAQLTKMAKQAKGVLQAEELAAVADRGYFSSLEILECAEAGITVTLPKPMTSGAKSQGRFGKQDFVLRAGKRHLPLSDRRAADLSVLSGRARHDDPPLLDDDVSKVPLAIAMHDGAAAADPTWEHGHLLEAVQERLDASPEAMRMRRETVEHPFGTMKARMVATHFLTKTLPKVATEMALSVLAYNLTRVMNIVGIKPLIAAIGA